MNLKITDFSIVLKEFSAGGQYKSMRHKWHAIDYIITKRGKKVNLLQCLYCGLRKYENEKNAYPCSGSYYDPWIFPWYTRKGLVPRPRRQNHYDFSYYDRLAAFMAKEREEEKAKLKRLNNIEEHQKSQKTEGRP